MKEIFNEDIFMIASGKNEAICITTNGMCKKDGTAVMGKGIAKSADDLYHVSEKLGIYLKKYGNRAFDLGLYSAYGQIEHHVLTFPTKNDWRYNSDINLIKKSAEEIVRICDGRGIDKCYLPPVGCTNGKLDYEKDVKPAIKDILDDRFVIILQKNGQL